MKIRSALIVGLAVIGLVVSPTPAQADTPPAVGFTGHTDWNETFEVIHDLRFSYGLNVTNGCADDNRCITIGHYRARDGYAGRANGWTGNATVLLNSSYDWGHQYRLEVLYHEIGHALGLWEHGPACQTSMEEIITGCGYTVVGYTATEQQKLKELWG